MNLVWSRRCVMFTVLLAACVAGALAPGRAEAALPQRGGMVGSSASTTIQAIDERVPMAGVQRCSEQSTPRAPAVSGIGRLIDSGQGTYDFVLQLNQDSLSQFSSNLMTFG
jgi:hypothetical protein